MGIGSINRLISVRWMLKCPQILLLPLLALAVSGFLTYFSLYYCIKVHFLIFGLPEKIQFRPKSDFIKYFPLQRWNHSGGYKLVLLWTPRHLNPTWRLLPLNSSSIVNTGACRVTRDRKLLSKADVVMFHAPDLPNLRQMPPERSPNQLYVMFTLETPNKNNADFLNYNNVINWTMTVRQDSDIAIGYSVLVKRPKINSLQQEYILQDIRKNSRAKSKLAVARISNCFTLHTPRIGYVRELQRYMDVDFYGLCAKTCPTGCDNVMKNYKFVLAFENSFCRNYFSEKLWDPLSYFYAVPVVLGGASSKDYSNVLPPHSYIDARNFPSLKALAEYLLLLHGNSTLYEQYFHWKLNYTVRELPFWETLCKAVHTDTKPAQVYTDLSGWSLDDSCHYYGFLTLLRLTPFLAVFSILTLVTMAVVLRTKCVRYYSLVQITVVLLLLWLIGVVLHLILREIR